MLLSHVFRVKRVREKYEVELTELERSERAAVERHQELRMKLMETEEELMRAKSELRQKDQTMEELTQVTPFSLSQLLLELTLTHDPQH